MKIHLLIGAALAAILMITTFFFLSDNEKEETQPDTSSVVKIAKSPKHITKTKIDFDKLKITSEEEIEKIAEERNRENLERLKHFEENGWQVVEIDDPPDPAITQIDPSLLKERETELLNQIQTNSFTGSELNRLEEIALKAENEKTRYVALEALGRSSEADAKKLLIDAYEHIDDESTKSQILGYLTPTSPNDEVSVFFAGQLANSDTPDALKEQAAFPLAVMMLLEDGKDDSAAEKIESQIPPAWKNKFADLIGKLKGGDQN